MKLELPSSLADRLQALFSLHPERGACFTEYSFLSGILCLTLLAVVPKCGQNISDSFSEPALQIASVTGGTQSSPFNTPTMYSMEKHRGGGTTGLREDIFSGNEPEAPEGRLPAETREIIE